MSELPSPAQTAKTKHAPPPKQQNKITRHPPKQQKNDTPPAQTAKIITPPPPKQQKNKHAHGPNRKNMTRPPPKQQKTKHAPAQTAKQTTPEKPKQQKTQTKKNKHSYRVQGVSVRGCAGAGSTQARALTCMSSPQLAFYPCFDLYRFRVLSNSDRAPVLLCVFCSCPDQAAARFGLGLARGFLCLLRLSLSWRPSLEQMDLSRLDGCKVWVWVWLETSKIFFRWSLGRRPPILNKWTCLGLHRFGGRFGVPSSKGDLMGYSPASCRVYHAAHSCLWDWELRRQPESLWLRSTSPAGFGAFALLDVGSLSSGLGDQGLGSKLFKGDYVSAHLKDYYCRY